MSSKKDQVVSLISDDSEDGVKEHTKGLALVKDGTFEGLDENAAKTWIFPTNLPCRQYQYDIIETALFHNTLVSLPTGLGKTMIAAVVMYNIYRWYPLARVIFMAPTRPLVAQQAEACRTITCIPSEHTTLLTGNVQSANRSAIWQSKRVIFLTPQILQKDLESKICPVDSIRCVVIDEAHRARGKYAYCEVMRLLGDRTMSQIRVLALSATPGATTKQVSEVIQALRISRLEIRTENSPDVQPYVFSKIIETEIVKLGEPLVSFREKYILILDHYTRRLMKAEVLTGSAGNIHKGRIFMVQKEYKAYCQRVGKRPDGFILQDLSFCLTLYHAYEVLIKHGLRGFLSFYNEGGNKAWIRKDNNLLDLLNEIGDYLKNDDLKVEILPDGTYTDIDPNVVFGHPKYYKLRDLVKNHFVQQPDTRVMIFCEYRDSVQEAFCALLTCRPLIRPRMFLGQSAISQKQQLNVMERFRSGECNTLICTCVAEEGLDVASVQLIICFDIANRSPVRLAQRMGRTGRHQVGKIVMLVTEGREQQTLEETLRQSNLLDVRLVQNPMVQANLMKAGPALCPDHVQPECSRLHLTSLDADSKKKKRPSRASGASTTWNCKDPIPDFQRITLKSKVDALWNKSKDEYFRVSSTDILTKNFASSFKSETNYRELIDSSTNSLLLQNLYKDAQIFKYNLTTFEKGKVPIKTKNQDIRNLFTKNVKTNLEDANDFVSVGVSSWKSFLINYTAELNKRNTLKALLDQSCLCCEQLVECPRLSRAITLEEPEEIPLSFPPNDSAFKCLTYDNLVQTYSDNLFEMDAQHFDFVKYNQEKHVSRLCANFSDEIVDDFDFSSQYFKVPTETVADAHQEPTDGVTVLTCEKAVESKDLKVFPEKFCGFSENQYVYDAIGKDALNFFGLNCLEDLFGEETPVEVNLKVERKTVKKPNTIDLYFHKSVEEKEITERADVERESVRYPGVDVQNESIIDYVLNDSTLRENNTKVTMDSPPRDSQDKLVLSPILPASQPRVVSRFFNSFRASQASSQPSPKVAKNLENSYSKIAELYTNYESDDDMFADDSFDTNFLTNIKVDPIKTTNETTKITIISPKTQVQPEKKTSLSLRKNLAQPTNYDSADESLLNFVKKTQKSNIENTPPPTVKSSNLNSSRDFSSFACSKNKKIEKNGFSSTLASKLNDSEWNSDDDFANFVLPKDKSLRSNKSMTTSSAKAGPSQMIDSDLGEIFDEDFTFSQVQTSASMKRSKTNSQKRKKRRKCTFIDDEAEHSSDYDESDDSEEENKDLSFVVNHVEDDVDLHPIYLKTTKSPIKTSGAFKIPQLPPVKMDEICSQVDWNIDESYVQDSFVTDTIVENNEISFLERVEMELERKRKAKRTKRKSGRIIVVHSDSSDEDTEMKKLRKFCLENRTISQ